MSVYRISVQEKRGFDIMVEAPTTEDAILQLEEFLNRGGFWEIDNGTAELEDFEELGIIEIEPNDFEMDSSEDWLIRLDKP